MTNSIKRETQEHADPKAQGPALTGRTGNNILTRLLHKLRLRVRSSFRKKDPDIYPFF